MRGMRRRPGAHCQKTDADLRNSVKPLTLGTWHARCTMNAVATTSA
jgi:hypothetical protein